MTAEIICVGTELLLGQIVNTDAQYLGRKLSAMGIDMYHQTVVGDNEARLLAALDEAFHRSDVIILTGGLGPTSDDITKETVAKYLGLSLHMHEGSLKRMRRRFQHMAQPMVKANLKQAMIPGGARVLDNDKGTAPGCILEEKGKTFIILPGPPFEMEDMFDKRVAPYLAGRTGEEIVSRVLRIYGIGESALEEELEDLIEGQTNPTIAPYAGTGEVTLRLTAKAGTAEEANALLDPLEARIRDRLEDRVYAMGEETLDKLAARLLMEENVTFALAESCTGGLLASKLVDNPGISQVFLEGLVTYSNESKVKRLHVSPETLDYNGAVSAKCAEEMAEGLLETSGAELALSVTGVAGPGGGVDAKPVGLVFIGMAQKGEETKVHQLYLTGDRRRVQNGAMLHAFDWVRRRILGLPEDRNC
ncbi:competence/damage-inducible protein A [Gehongia tenuis]|uniref:Putative competence-damage inducible protein n=1 Tax=Gehongia tenuis TaxID=2763655 RepID=A0A926D1F5_9FIRM|nr:competence/damage-inducible protein A [Gehongia tenuis]